MAPATAPTCRPRKSQKLPPPQAGGISIVALLRPAAGALQAAEGPIETGGEADPMPAAAAEPLQAAADLLHAGVEVQPVSPAAEPLIVAAEPLQATPEPLHAGVVAQPVSPAAVAAEPWQATPAMTVLGEPVAPAAAEPVQAATEPMQAGVVANPVSPAAAEPLRDALEPLQADGATAPVTTVASPCGAVRAPAEPLPRVDGSRRGRLLDRVRSLGAEPFDFGLGAAIAAGPIELDSGSLPDLSPQHVEAREATACLLKDIFWPRRLGSTNQIFGSTVTPINYLLAVGRPNNYL